MSWRRVTWVVGGLVAVTLGALVLAAGAGIAVPHLTRAGMNSTTAWGTLALLTGLALLAAGTHTLAVRLRWWGRIPVVLAVLAGTLVMLLSLGPAVAATTVPRASLAALTPTHRGLAHEDVRFRSAEGVLLSGWYLPSTNGAAVVLLHGAGSTRSAVLEHATVLNRQDYGVLLLDARGHGLSEGRAMDFGWWGEVDVPAAVTFLAAREEVDATRIGVVGLSMGGEQAIGALAVDPRIRVVVAEGATGRTAADNAWYSDVYGTRGRLQEWIDGVRYQFVDLLTEAPEPASLRSAAAVASPRPVLLIVAGTVPDERYAAGHIRAGSPGSVRTWVVEGARHTGALAAAGGEWRERVVTFLDAAFARPVS
ncbi:MAG: alpha/beta hydrolase [Actinomycetota bacterium]